MPPVRYCVSYSSYEVLFSLNKGYTQTGQRPVQCLHGHLILLSGAVKSCLRRWPLPDLRRAAVREHARFPRFFQEQASG